MPVPARVPVPEGPEDQGVDLVVMPSLGLGSLDESRDAQQVVRRAGDMSEELGFHDAA